VDRQLQERIGQALGCLAKPIMLLDSEGRCAVPAGGRQYKLPTDHPEGRIAAQDGMLFLQTGCSGMIAAAPEGTDPDVLTMAAMLCSALCGGGEGGVLNAYRRLLQSELPANEAETLLAENGIDRAAMRAVMIMSMPNVKRGTAQQTLMETIPMTPVTDILVPVDSRTSVLIKGVAAGEGQDDLQEYAAAVRETVQGETGDEVIIAISDIAPNAGELHNAYLQAEKAAEIGRVFRPEEHVYVYGSMLMERFIADIPAEMAAQYHAMLFNRRTQRVLNDEILETALMFFQKDLNLSDTARQLYIHRNTLVYRLDKIQKFTGLDLRKFDDAVTFRMMLEMKKRGEMKDKKTV